MAERPRAGSSVPPDDEATESSGKKKGESDALFNPPGLKRRSTFMGLAPAPHLGGLSGSPGAIARAEEEARRQRVLNRHENGAMGQVSPSTHPREELIEPVPQRPGTEPPPPAGQVVPAFGTGTMLMMRTPNIPRLEQDPAAPAHPAAPAYPPAADSSAPNVLSEPTILMQPRHPVTGPPPAGVDPRRFDGAAHPHPSTARPYEEPIEAPPNTERMFQPSKTASVHPSQSLSQPPPPAGMVVRRWEPESVPPAALPLPHDRRLVLVTDPDSQAADAYRVLRDSLIAKNLPRVVAVSSPLPRDGKTTCAINLALALTEQPATRVLLLDGNFFEPELARIFHMDRLPMLMPPEAEHWLPPYRLAQVSPNLHLAAILPSEIPRRRFDQHRFDALVDRLCRASYDYIVMDAPALHGSPAVGQLLSVADATLLAIRAGGGTTGRELRRAVDQIPKNKALGIALIDG